MELEPAFVLKFEELVLGHLSSDAFLVLGKVQWGKGRCGQNERLDFLVLRE